MVAVHRSYGPDISEQPNPHIDIGVLKLQLDYDRERSDHRDIGRNTHKQPWQGADRDLDQLVNGVFKQTIETVHSSDRMMDRVEPP